MGIFQKYSLFPGMRIFSHARVWDDACKDSPFGCKRTTMGAGTYELPADTLQRAGVLTTPGWEAQLEAEIGWIRR